MREKEIKKERTVEDRSVDLPSAEYYESRRDFLVKLAEARRERDVPKREKNPLTLCPAQ